MLKFKKKPEIWSKEQNKLFNLLTSTAALLFTIPVTSGL